MTLGEIIKQYRSEHSMSMDAFAGRSGMSKQYISILEKNCHPKTGKPVIPSITMINKAAAGMGISFDDLFAMLDGDVRIDAKPANATLSAEELDIIDAYRSCSPELQSAVRTILGVKTETHEAREDAASSSSRAG